MTKQNHVTFVIFGGTGDLTKQKLVPAFSGLLQDGDLTTDSTIVGIARGEFTDASYKQLLLESTRNEEERKCISKLNVRFYRSDSAVPGALDGLATLLKSFEHAGCNRIFYLATSYKIFPGIVENLKRAGLHKSKGCFTRIVFEKPFGSDYKSAMELEKKIHAVFSEEQIFRIDHYLGKETVQNINVLKFTNPLLDSVLSSKFVDRIEIVSDESTGVGQRLGYYEGVGAVKDMIQSHLLQVASLVLMERPKALTAECIHDKKVQILKKIKVLPAKNHIFGQYATYKDELHHAKLPVSKTETFCRLAFICQTPRWKGTQILLQTGKMLTSKYSQIIIHFKGIGSDFSHKLAGVKENKLVIDIHPTEDIVLYVNTRKRFSTKQIEYVPLEFCGDCHFGPNTTDGYKRLLSDVISGDKTLFTRLDELRESWRIVEKIEPMRKNIPFVIYQNGINPATIGGIHAGKHSQK